MKKRFSVLLFLVLAAPHPALAMHIAEGLLPLEVAVFWGALTLPFLAFGIYSITRKKKESPNYMPLLGIFGAAVFVFSCLPIPIPGVGATAHPAGTGFSAIMIGPFPTVVVAFISLLLQGMFLAHGGLTTLGANTFSMGVMGAFAGFFAFKFSRLFRFNLFWSGFMAGMFANFFTYLGTSFALASGLHGTEPFLSEVAALFALLAPYTVALALLEGAITGGILVYVNKNRPDILRKMRILPPREVETK